MPCGNITSVTLQNAINSELSDSQRYMLWYKETGKKEFKRMAMDEKRHASTLQRLMRGG